MPYYTDLGLYTPSPSTTPYSKIYVPGRYANHSSIIASNFSSPLANPLPRSFGRYKPHLTTISESQSLPLRRLHSPKLILHSSPKVIIPRPRTINTADIDVSVNKYRKYEKPNSQPLTVDKEKRSSKSPSPVRTEAASPKPEDEYKTSTIRRDRPTIRLQTVHKRNRSRKEEPQGEVSSPKSSWREAVGLNEPNENKEKRPRKSPGKILIEKHLIRDKDSSENFSETQSKKEKKISRKPSVKRQVSVPRSPSFHDICRAISSDTVNEDLNPGQPDEVRRKQSRQFSTDDILKHFRSDSSSTINTILKEDSFEDDSSLRSESMEIKSKDISSTSDERDSGRGSLKTRKKITKKKSNEKVILKEGNEENVASKDSKNIPDAEDMLEARDSGRGSVKTKKKVTKKKSNDKLILSGSDTENKSTLQRRLTQKKLRRNSTDTSIISNVSAEDEKAYQHAIRDISQVEVEEIKSKPKPIITGTVDVESSKPNLKVVVDDIAVEEVQSPKAKKQAKLKFNFTVGNIESKKAVNKEDKMAIERGKIQLPKTKEPIVANLLKKKHVARIGHVLEDIKEVTPKEEKRGSLEQKETSNTNQKDNVQQIQTSKAEQQLISSTIQKGSVKQIETAIPEQQSTIVQPNQTQDEQLPQKKSIFGNKLKPEENNQINQSQGNKQNLKQMRSSLKVSPKPFLHITNSDVSSTPKSPVKDENHNTENFWEDIGTRESVYYQNRKNALQRKASVIRKQHTNNNTITELPTENKEENIKKSDSNEETEIAVKDKVTSKGSLVFKRGAVDDPDLEVFVPPEPELEPEPEPEPEKDVFVPLQSNRLSQWMHPFKKPEQLDECPVEIYATPKYIRKRHYPRPRHAPAAPPPQSESSEESEEETSEEESSDSSSEEEYETNIVYDQGKVGASTSSNDSGFDSAVKGNKTRRNKGSSESRDSPTANHAHNPAFALDPGDPLLLEDYQQSSTYTSFQKSGRITPPATTIPRFRKYCVEDFNFLKVLGKGSFGKVLLAELKNTEYYYAIKCLKKDVVLEDDDVECTLIERKVLALGTKHPYLCHLLCTFQTESHLFFVMEYLNGGDLMFHIQQSGRFPEPQARFYGAEIVSGLKFLHNKGIVYRDLKLDNILLDFDGHVRIADFGMCKLQIFLDRMADTFCGTPDYMAPEIIKGLHYNQCVDWWSFGVLLYEMLLGQSPFSGCDEDELFWSICNEKPVLPRFLSTEASSILTLFLEKDPAKRLGCRDCPAGNIQDQPFFKPINWERLESRQLEPPFKPNLQHPLDTQYFDTTFTVEKAKLTPIEKNILQSMDQTQFQGFSYTNPNATDK